MNLKDYSPLNETEDSKTSVLKNTDTLIEQTYMKPQETIQLILTKFLESFFNSQTAITGNCWLDARIT